MKRILIIDDDEPTRTAMRNLLQRAGYEIIEAINGLEGIRSFRRNPTDLLITDLLMPEKDGFETIREIRREFPGTKIILLSGKGARFLEMAQDFGADRTFPKPFSPRQVLNAVRELLGDAPPA